MAIRKPETESVIEPVTESVTEPVTEPVVEDAKSAVRPVKLKAVKFKIRSPESGILYTPHAPVDLNDFNAPASYFERAQVREGVLVIVEG